MFSIAHLCLSIWGTTDPNELHHLSYEECDVDLSGDSLAMTDLAVVADLGAHDMSDMFIIDYWRGEFLAFRWIYDQNDAEYCTVLMDEEPF